MNRDGFTLIDVSHAGGCDIEGAGAERGGTLNYTEIGLPLEPGERSNR